MKEDHDNKFPDDFEPPFPPATKKALSDAMSGGIGFVSISTDGVTYINPSDVYLDLDFLDTNKIDSGTPYRPSTKSWDD